MQARTIHLQISKSLTSAPTLMKILYYYLTKTKRSGSGKQVFNQLHPEDFENLCQISKKSTLAACAI